MEPVPFMNLSRQYESIKEEVKSAMVVLKPLNFFLIRRKKFMWYTIHQIQGFIKLKSALINGNLPAI